METSLLKRLHELKEQADSSKARHFRAFKRGWTSLALVLLAIIVFSVGYIWVKYEQMIQPSREIFGFSSNPVQLLGGILFLAAFVSFLLIIRCIYAIRSAKPDDFIDLVMNEIFLSQLFAGATADEKLYQAFVPFYLHGVMPNSAHSDEYQNASTPGHSV